MQADNKQFTTLWNQLFVKSENSSKGDYIASLVANSVTIIDLFLLYRKLKKNYGGLMGLFGKKSGNERKKALKNAIIRRSQTSSFTSTTWPSKASWMSDGSWAFTSSCSPMSWLGCMR